ncbi:MAG: tRNA (N(6)-L-threonylcarbamoyladenosine(37)-C(2))-methylthiotransferase MtaB [Bacteroidales bacterium]|nr:tRNA (N(6)-L-threonylcarbamoyladenosine(37)-C(2))-methylthiotransferase MtaB [Bacteroidales bacterium]
MRIAAHTLGCKLNYAETSDLLRRIAASGHTIVDFSQTADLYLINTCTVTATAEKKCRNAISQAHRTNPEAQIAVVGCFAQVAAEQLKQLPGVSLVLGNDRKHLLPALLQNQETLNNQNTPINPSIQSNPINPSNPINQPPQPLSPFTPQYSLGDRTRSFLKIQDGCDYFCTYCAIPLARGRSRSATIASTLHAAREIARSGAREIVLTGVNTGTFGLHNGETLLDLLRALDTIEGIARYRISSIEPNLLTPDIISFIASSRAFLPHFHIPLQAGSDHVLQLMHRRYTTALYREKAELIHRLMPDACIAADILAGFNGETEPEFRSTLQFLSSLPIAYLHVFTYSDRPGTAALRLPEKIPVAVRHEHTARLLALSARLHRSFLNSQMGQSRPVLWESSPHGHLMHGLTDNYIRLATPYDPTLINTIQTLTLTPSLLADPSDFSD